MIDHNLVTILLSVEWAERGDDPSLVIDITNKRKDKYLVFFSLLFNISYLAPSVPCFQQNPPSLLVNSVHHHQHQESLGSAHQQQQYYHQSGMNSYDLSNSTITNPTVDHNDVSSMTTTTTVVYNSLQPQHQTSSSIAIQKIKSELQSQLSMFRRPPPLNQSYLSPQHVIQAPSNDFNDSRLDMNVLTIK